MSLVSPHARFLLVLALSSHLLQAATWHVDASRTGASPQNGTSWASAFADLQDALSAASSGDAIWIADGAYYPDEAEAGVATVVADSISSTFLIPNGVSLYGGFSGNETSLDQRDASTHITVLSGDLEQDDAGRDANLIVTNASSLFSGDLNALTILTVTPDSTGVTLDGLVFTSGLHNSTNQPAALLIEGGVTEIKDCRFQGNVGDQGGAVHIDDGLESVEATFLRCQFISNHANDNGGAINLTNDKSPAGSGTFINCLFEANRANSTGGALRVTEDTNTTVLGCSFISNYAGSNGGAFSFAWYADEPVFHFFTNCTFTGNVSAASGGALFLCNEGSVGDPEATSFLMLNSIIANNKELAGTATESASYHLEGNVTPSFSSNYLENINPGGDNIDGTDSANAPIFLNPVNLIFTPNTLGDARLKGESPGIDVTGDSALPLDTYDLDSDGNTSEKLPQDLAGNDRIINSQLDLGAYEYDGPTVVSPITENIEISSSSLSTTTIDLDAIFGSADYTYAATVSSTSAFSNWEIDHAEGNFEINTPFGNAGDTATVTITATDSNGNQISYSFTVEILAASFSDTLTANLSSWYTERSGRYARIYETDANQSAGIASSTWTRSTTQSLPVYASPRELSYSNDWIYVKTAALSAQIMGPWYVDDARNNLFQDLPTNQALIVRFPRIPAQATTANETGLGPIGYYVDGTAFFNMSDGFSYDTSAAEDHAPGSAQGIVGDGVWNRDAKVTEGVTTDATGSHQAGGFFHNHTTPKGVRYLIGDSMDWAEATNTYTNNFNNLHSPILGWANDGLPIYGPYGYDDPNDSGSTIRRMTSGYQLRDGSNGSADLTAGRTSLPEWVASLQGRSTTLVASEYGPSTTTTVDGETYSIGRYMEDYAYMGDLGLTQGTDFDLNEYNARFCITPEFPEGTWAYFNCIDDSGDSQFPYTVGPAYFANPTGGNVDSIDESVTVSFQGGEDKTESNTSITEESDEIVLIWSVVEGGIYTIQSSPDLSENSFDDEITDVTADTDSLPFVDPDLATQDAKFYRINRTGIATYDDTPFGEASEASEITNVSPDSGHGIVTLSFDFAAGATGPGPDGIPPSEVTLGGVSGSSISNTNGTVSATFDLSSLSMGIYDIIATFNGMGGETFTYTGTAVFTVTTTGGGTTSFAFTFSTTPGLPPQGAVQNPAVGGVSATITSYNQAAGNITMEFDNSTLASGNHTATFSFTPPMGTTQNRTSTNTYTK